MRLKITLFKDILAFLQLEIIGGGRSGRQHRSTDRFHEDCAITKTDLNLLMFFPELSMVEPMSRLQLAELKALCLIMIKLVFNLIQLASHIYRTLLLPMFCNFVCQLRPLPRTSVRAKHFKVRRFQKNLLYGVSYFFLFWIESKGVISFFLLS